MNGLHLIGDFYRCACGPAFLLEPGALEAFSLDACRDAGLTPVGRLFHGFVSADGQAAGFTGVVVLAESHLAIHTWPETASVTLDLYVCNFSTDNRDSARRVFSALRDLLRPGSAVCREVERGQLPDAVAFCARQASTQGANG